MRARLAQARPLIYLLVTILVRAPVAPPQVKLKTTHAANRSHVRSGGLVKPLNGGGQATGV